MSQLEPATLLPRRNIDRDGFVKCGIHLTGALDCSRQCSWLVVCSKSGMLYCR